MVPRSNVTLAWLPGPRARLYLFARRRRRHPFVVALSQPLATACRGPRPRGRALPPTGRRPPGTPRARRPARARRRGRRGRRRSSPDDDRRRGHWCSPTRTPEGQLRAQDLALSRRHEAWGAAGAASARSRIVGDPRPPPCCPIGAHPAPGRPLRHRRACCPSSATRPAARAVPGPGVDTFRGRAAPIDACDGVALARGSAGTLGRTASSSPSPWGPSCRLDLAYRDERRRLGQPRATTPG